MGNPLGPARCRPLRLRCPYVCCPEISRMLYLPLLGETPLSIPWSYFRLFTRPPFVRRVRELSAGDLWEIVVDGSFYIGFQPLGRPIVWVINGEDFLLRGASSPRKRLNMVKKKFIPPAPRPKAKKQESPDCLDSGFGDSFPMLWGYLSCKVDADGSPREPASISLFAEGGGWKGYLYDRQEHQKLWAGSDTFMGVFEQLETFLGDANAHWREDWQGKTGKRK